MVVLKWFLGKKSGILGTKYEKKRKKCRIFWWFQIFVVPLQSLLSNGGIAQLVRAHDS